MLKLQTTPSPPTLRARALSGLGSLMFEQGDYASARAVHQESLGIRREQSDLHGVASSLDGLAWLANAEGDYSTGRALHQESLCIRRQLDDKRGIASSLTGLGYIASVQADHVAARAYHEESLAIRRQLGDTQGIANSLVYLGWLRIDQQDFPGARGPLAEGLTLARELGDATVVVDGLEISAYLAMNVGRMDRAARLQGAADALRETIGVPMSPSEHSLYDGELATVRAALGEPEFAAAWAEGRAMSMEQAVAYGLNEAGGS